MDPLAASSPLEANPSSWYCSHHSANSCTETYLRYGAHCSPKYAQRFEVAACHTVHFNMNCSSPSTPKPTTTVHTKLRVRYATKRAGTEASTNRQWIPPSVCRLAAKSAPISAGGTKAKAACIHGAACRCDNASMGKARVPYVTVAITRISRINDVGSIFAPSPRPISPAA